MARTTRPPSAAERWYRHGADLVRAGRYLEAIEPLEQALAYSAEEPEAPWAAPLRSYYGLALALGRGELARGRRLCEEATAGSTLRSDLFTNLARIYLRQANRRLAVEALVTALSIQPRDREAWELLAGLGVRRPPVVRFLSRSNPINRALGAVRHRLFGSSPPAL
ncbi:MAG: tetratricopeptide repeat protein [Acidobacteriota bacterium]|nr:MAG: hypothetical protein D6738_06900 [Acidobacteriota bacterium]